VLSQETEWGRVWDEKVIAEGPDVAIDYWELNSSYVALFTGSKTKESLDMYYFNIRRKEVVSHLQIANDIGPIFSV